MKNILFTSALFLLCYNIASAQAIPQTDIPEISCSYDEAGNRIQRRIIGISSWKTDSSEIYNIVNEGSLNVFPNPVSTHLNVQSNIEVENAVIELYTTTGQLLVKENYNGFNTTINMAEYPSGVYYLHLRKEEDFFTWKIVKP